MAKELHFEIRVCDWMVSKLGYTLQEKSMVSPHTWLLEADLIAMIKRHQLNDWKRILRDHYAGDEASLKKAFCQAVHEFVYKEDNVAIRIGRTFINTSRDRFKFHEVDFALYHPVVTEDTNKYSLVRQLTLSFEGNNQKLLKRPDVVTFLNGIPFSALQLKLLSSRQSASSDGRKQVSRDFVDVVRLDLGNQTDTNATQPSAFYRGLTHILTMDEVDVYSWRTMLHSYNAVKQFHQKAYLHSGELVETLAHKFFKEPTLYNGEYAQFEGNEYPWQSVLYRLFRKEAVGFEFDYNRKDRTQSTETKKGQEHVLTTGDTKALPRVPRPMQVYGVEKTIQAVRLAYATEHIPNYATLALEQQLKAAGVPAESVATILAERAKYRNGIDHFSMLLQYAPGAGKTDIIALLAGRLRELMQSDVLAPEANPVISAPLIDKIVICTDRLDLKNQTFKEILGTNINRAHICRVDNRTTLKKVLQKGGSKESNSRIIVVNIQKFKSAKEWSSGFISGFSRTAFLIDEIHRSNTGEQHQSMMTLFENLAQAIRKDQSKTKNLIIGFTATPTEETLMKFGQFKLYPGSFQWEPLDAYTFTDAVRDGYILNPLDGLYAMGAAMSVQLIDPETMRKPSKTELYENEDRIAALSNEMARYMVKTTFNQIRKTGCAMVVAHSVKAAITYYEKLKAALAAQGSFKPVYILYSSKEGVPKSHTLCGFPDEPSVIADYKKNGGVIIVVDKLQTGFDEPKLHTLFLDKEVSGVNAVQTACRVNRIAPHKKSCVVIDCSIDNVNLKNIRDAFAKYGDYVCTSSNITVQIDHLVMDYSALQSNPTFRALFNDFKRATSSEDQLVVQTAISTHVKNAYDAGSELVAKVERLRLLGEDTSELINDTEDPVRTMQALRSKLVTYVSNVVTVNSIAPLQTIDARLVNDTFLKYVKVWLNVLVAYRADDVEELELAEAQLDACGWIEAPPPSLPKQMPDQTISQRRELSTMGLRTFSAISEHGDTAISDHAKSVQIENYQKRLHYLFDCIRDPAFNSARSVAGKRFAGFIEDVQSDDYDFGSAAERTTEKFIDSLTTVAIKIKNSNSISAALKESSLLARLADIPEPTTLVEFANILRNPNMVSLALADFHDYLVRQA